MRSRLLVVLGCVAVLACGGKTLGSGDGTDGGNATHDASSSGSDVATSADSPFAQPDSSLFEDVSVPPGVACTQGPSGGSSSGGSCEIMLSETCSDGSSYQVSCECPGGSQPGSCSCAEMNGMSGGSGGGGSFPGCPICPTPGEAWKYCGFPQ